MKAYKKPAKSLEPAFYSSPETNSRQWITLTIAVSGGLHTATQHGIVVRTALPFDNGVIGKRIINGRTAIGQKGCLIYGAGLVGNRVPAKGIIR